jgi:hypothetical protein
MTGKEAMRSPGAPTHRREIERWFWDAIKTGVTSEAAATVNVGRKLTHPWAG